MKIHISRRPSPGCFFLLAASCCFSVICRESLRCAVPRHRLLLCDAGRVSRGSSGIESVVGFPAKSCSEWRNAGAT